MSEHETAMQIDSGHVADSASCPERHCNKCDKYREENERYREIGTVKELRELKEGSLSGLELAAVCVAMSRLKKYEAAGTIEECQEARELQEPAETQEVLSASGRGVYQCKNCGNELYVNSFSGVYCHWCGKKLKWGDKT